MDTVSGTEIQREPILGDAETRIRGRHEGRMTTAIERRTSMLPSSFFLALAGGSIVGSLALQMSGRKEDALFVGQWAPTFLLFGIYNKIVKTAGHGMFE